MRQRCLANLEKVDFRLKEQFDNVLVGADLERPCRFTIFPRPFLNADAYRQFGTSFGIVNALVVRHRSVLSNNWGAV